MAEYDVAITMTAVLGTMIAIIAGLVAFQTPRKDGTLSSFYPSKATQPSKLAYERFVAAYSPVWMTGFGVIIALQKHIETPV